MNGAHNRNTSHAMSASQSSLPTRHGYAPTTQTLLSSHTKPLDTSHPSLSTTNYEPQHFSYDDPVLHLLAENALEESANYNVLSEQDVETLQGHIEHLGAQIEEEKRKLNYEVKLRDAGKSVGRLGGESRKRQKTTDGREGDDDEETRARAERIDEMSRDVSELEREEMGARRKLLEHNAAVLSLRYGRKEAGGDSGGAHEEDPALFGPKSMYGAHQDIFEIEHELKEPTSKIDNKEFDGQNRLIFDVERRVEELNAKLRDMILELKPPKEQLPIPAKELKDDPDRAGDILWDQVGFLENCVFLIHDLKEKDIQGLGKANSEFESRLGDLNRSLFKAMTETDPGRASQYTKPPELDGSSVHVQIDYLEGGFGAVRRRLADLVEDSGEFAEGELEGLNYKMFEIMVGDDPEKRAKYEPPPKPTGNGLRDQLDYMAGGLNAMGRRLKQAEEIFEENRGKLDSFQKRGEQYGKTIGELWDLLLASERPGDKSPSFNDDPEIDNFSLQAFASKVIELHNRSVSWETQKDVLTRQIQQQREVNEKGDFQKDQIIRDTQQELGHVKAELEVADRQVHSHFEKLTETVEELSAAKSALASREQSESQELQRLNAQLQEAAQRAELASVNNAALKSDVEEKTATLAKAQMSYKDLESQVAHLQTELTIAKTELDHAHGSRAQRAAEAAAEVPTLQARIHDLQKELSETISDYEAMTKAAIDDEKERETLEAMVDRLKDEVESWKAQVHDERIQNIGSPNSATSRATVVGATSASVLKTEFKKMMRETKMEHAKALRAEQEERRRLEGLLRNMKREQLPQVAAKT